MFFTGSQDVIGATKLDEKMLVENRKQEEVPNQSDAPSGESEESSEDSEDSVAYEPGLVEGGSGQTTLFGGEN